jgi:SAM-dependent methyltransferase
MSATRPTDLIDTSPAKGFAYVDAAFNHMGTGDDQAPFWRAFHWGLFEDPDNPRHQAGDPDVYYAAGEKMTEAVITAAGISDGTRVLDVGCGFGGTLDHIAARNEGCRLAGLNIDERQVRRARELLAEFARGTGGPIPFIVGDGCRLPVASGSLDHLLAVECLFHFPSRKTFIKEASRVLKPGGTFALTDFIAAPGALAHIAARIAEGVEAAVAQAQETGEEAAPGVGDTSWYGHQSKPPTIATYERYGRAVGLDMIVDDDVTRQTMPTYPALRNIYSSLGYPDGADSVTGLEDLAKSGHLGYHVVAFRKRGA